MTARECGRPVPWPEWILSRMRLLRLLRIGLILVVPATLPALAYASPPDPSWIQGVYDDADGDDVIALTLSAAAGTPTDAADAQPLHLLIGCLSDRDERAPVTPSASAAQPRAPPPS
jgi:hypothetical protein